MGKKFDKEEEIGQDRLVKKVVVIGGVLLGVVWIVSAGLKKPTVKTASFQTAKGKTTSDAAGWERFHSDQFGYFVKHPKGWIVNDSGFAKKQEIWVVETTKKAAVKINAFFDKSLNSEEAVKGAIGAFREKMNSEPDLRVTEFKDSMEGKVGGFIAKGEETIGGEKFIFENRGLIATNGKILIFHGNFRADEAEKYGGVIPKIIESFGLDEN